MSKRVCVKTNCCAVQRNETYRISRFFKLNGWQEVASIEDADMIIITTCGVTKESEENAFQMIKEAYVSSCEQKRVVVSGCLPNICAQKLHEHFPDAIYISLDKLTLFDELINAKVSISSVFYNADPQFHHSEGDPRLDANKYDAELMLAHHLSNAYNNHSFIEAYNYSTQGRYLWKDDSIFEIKISSGCTQKCNYCASRMGIGSYNSKPLNNILRELDIAISNGYTNIMLIGDELGAYGIDIDTSLPELLDCIIATNDKLRIGIRYIHPTYLLQLFPILGNYLKYVFFMCISIQSASGKVLSEMNRDNNITEVENSIVWIRNHFPSMYLHTQIIIGFPTETQDDFMKTMTFLQNCKFDYVRYNVFSPREGTDAYKMTPCYTPSELESRIQIMKAFCRTTRKEILYDRYVKLISDLNEA